MTYKGKPIDEWHAPSSGVQHGLAFEEVLAANWAGITDRYDYLPRWQKAKVLAAFETKMHLDAVLAYQQAIEQRAKMKKQK